MNELHRPVLSNVAYFSLLTPTCLEWYDCQYTT